MVLRTSIQIGLALAVALGLGTASVRSALDADVGRAALVVGNWTADPDSGRPGGENPYSRARASRQPQLPLGVAEGLIFRTSADSTGRRLSRDCVYLLDGPVPASRFWTLHVEGGSPAEAPPPSLHSMQLLRSSDNAFAVTVGRRIAPGNWLPISGDGPMTVVLTLYDTPVASTTALTDIGLPQIRRGLCDA